jgi:lipopolysaccharide export LptBFGC system permease protein LptF
MDSLIDALYGAHAALSLVAALFFVRYWRRSGDRFFVFVAIAFAALAVNFASLAGQIGEAERPFFFLPRLGAFVILLIGIIDKNRRAS